MEKRAFIIDIEGIVQGVGFRPFLYTLAQSLGLKGWILNRGNSGVRMHVEGEPGVVSLFTSRMQRERPPISRVDAMDVEEQPTVAGFTTMEIRPSEDAKGPSIVLPADISTCDECLAEMNGKSPEKTQNKYYKYPFVACATCGPRFTTVIDLPYDRDRTTMSRFPLCPSCQSEYSNVSDRRYHAQTFACAACGPVYTFQGAGDVEAASGETAFALAAELLASGKALAMKGIGGVHLVVDATLEEAVEQLRGKKRRQSNKPFAVMLRSAEDVVAHATASPADLEWLSTHRRPIVLLERSEGTSISPLVAPGLTSIGFMLPYMGSQYLLLQEMAAKGTGPLVVTSGNVPGLPMAITREQIMRQLGGIADGFLLHDRPIYQRCDDSVGKVLDGNFVLIRRSRGWVPEFVPCPLDTGEKVVVAVGPELHSTATILRGKKAFVTQHVGDVTNLETLEFLEEVIEHHLRLLRVEDHEVAAVACDAHPAFHSTALAKDLAKKYGSTALPVLHHHAHCGSLAMDNKITPGEPCLYVTIDGVGMGDDGSAWGGEMFAGPLDALERVVTLVPRAMPGGDACVSWPGRMAASVLGDVMDRGELRKLLVGEYLHCFKNGEREIDVVLGLLAQKNRNPATSSLGRLLDAASVLLGASTRMTYEGEPAMRLEGLGSSWNKDVSTLVGTFMEAMDILEGPGLVRVDVAGALLLLLDRAVPTAARAKAFQVALGKTLGSLAASIAKARGLGKVLLGGGVSYNKFIFHEIRAAVQDGGLTFMHHHHLPAGDGGVSAGQALVAALSID